MGMARDADGFTLGLVQMAMGGTPAANLERAIVRIREAAASGAQLVCLPELFRTRYLCQSENPAAFDLAESIPGPTTCEIGRVAREARITVIVPLFERRAPGLYHNSVAVIGADGVIAGLYRKMHIPDDPAYYEKYYFAPGDLGFHTVDTAVGRIGVLICWDQWFPEAARLMALRGAEVLVYPTAIGWHPHEKATLGDAQRDAWRTVQRGHAIANGVYVAAVNRVGFEPGPASDGGLEFWGSSFICDPQGVVLDEAGSDGEALTLARIDRGRIESVRRSWPFLRDRRIDAYGGLTSRFLDDVPPAGEM